MSNLKVTGSVLGTVAFVAVVLMSLWMGASALDLQGVQGSLGVAFVAVMLIGGLVSPSVAILVFLFFLPVFGGNKPTTPQTVFFYQTFSALIAGVGVRWMAHVCKASLSSSTLGGISMRLHHPTSLALMLFVLAGFFSLSSLPYKVVAASWAALGPHKALGFISSGEGSIIYPYLTMALQAQCVLFFLLILNFPAQWKPRPEKWLIASLAGLVTSLLAGLADYYNLIDLRVLRALDPYVNPGDVQGRLQSFFGHSGWYAQYLTLVIPSALMVLTFPLKMGWRIALILMILVLAEYVLILTFQRGGWLSYPLTVAVIWFCIYVLNPKRSAIPIANLARKSLLKILISIPITIAVSLAVLSVVGSASDGGLQASQYAKRFKQIANTSDRTRYIPIALNLTSLYPIYGGGSESFSYRYVESYLRPSGKFKDEPKTIGWYHGSAHNVYLQTMTGKGVVGLLALVALLASFAWVAFSLLARNFIPADSAEPLGHDQKIIAMLGLSFAAAFAIYGNVQEIFYIPSLTVIMFLVAGVVVSQVPMSMPQPKRTVPSVFVAASVLFVGHLGWIS